MITDRFRAEPDWKYLIKQFNEVVNLRDRDKERDMLHCFMSSCSQLERLYFIYQFLIRKEGINKKRMKQFGKRIRKLCGLAQC